MNKLKVLAAEMDEPELYGEAQAEILLLGWGSTYGVLREAVDELVAGGKKAAMLHFSDLWPLPCKRLHSLLPGVKTSFCVENNATGQLAALIRRETGMAVDQLILKYNGRPFFSREILQEVKKHG